MSSIYKDLSTEDLKTENSPSLRNSAPNPKFTGLKIAIFFSFLLSFAALAGAAYLYHQLNTERSQREALEASQVQIQEKASAFQKNAKSYSEQVEKLRAQ